MKVNGKETVKLRSRSIKFENNLKNHLRFILILSVMGKELRLVIEKIMLHITLKNIKQILLAVLLTKLFVFVMDSASQLFFTEEKLWFIDSLKQFLETDYYKKVIKKHFNKNLVISEKDEQIFQSSNKCWICDKLFDIGDNKVRETIVTEQGNIEVLLIGVVILILG